MEELRKEKATKLINSLPESRKISAFIKTLDACGIQYLIKRDLLIDLFLCCFDNLISRKISVITPEEAVLYSAIKSRDLAVLNQASFAVVRNFSGIPIPAGAANPLPRLITNLSAYGYHTGTAGILVMLASAVVDQDVTFFTVLLQVLLCVHLANENPIPQKMYAHQLRACLMDQIVAETEEEEACVVAEYSSIVTTTLLQIYANAEKWKNETEENLYYEL